MFPLRKPEFPPWGNYIALHFNRLSLPVIPFYILVKVVIKPQAESFCLADNVLLGSRIDKVLSFTGKVIVLTPEVGNKPQAECARHPNREQL